MTFSFSCARKCEINDRTMRPHDPVPVMEASITKLGPNFTEDADWTRSRWWPRKFVAQVQPTLSANFWLSIFRLTSLETLGRLMQRAPVLPQTLLEPSASSVTAANLHELKRTCPYVQAEVKHREVFAFNPWATHTRITTRHDSYILLPFQLYVCGTTSLQGSTALSSRHHSWPQNVILILHRKWARYKLVHRRKGYRFVRHHPKRLHLYINSNWIDMAQ